MKSRVVGFLGGSGGSDDNILGSFGSCLTGVDAAGLPHPGGGLEIPPTVVVGAADDLFLFCEEFVFVDEFADDECEFAVVVGCCDDCGFPHPGGGLVIPG